MTRRGRRRERPAHIERQPRVRARALPNISVIFPAFNEEMNLETVVKSALKILPSVSSVFEIIIVNDGSRDQTGEVARGLAAFHPAIQVVHHPQNRGYGAALKSGIEQAKNDLIFFCDSDGQFTLEDLPRLLAWIDRFDMVIGYREKRQDPLHRRLNAAGWNLLVRSLFGLRVRDIDCAFKVFRRQIFDRVGIDTVGAMVNTEILSRSLRHGFSMKEVPVRHFPRQFGEQTGAKPRVILKAFYELAKMYVKIYLTPAPEAVKIRQA
jgi:glycosyltransferase involved in cell wall biosynthesis